MEQTPQDEPSLPVSPRATPLGHRGPKASTATNQPERDNMNAALLDKMHTAAYKSDSLTLFNDLAPLPAPVPATEDKPLLEDQHGRLTGLYSRIRESVGGMRDIVSGGTRSADRSAAETPAIKSPSSERSMSKSASDLASSMAEYPPSHTNSSQGSRLHSPVMANFQANAPEAVSNANANPTKGSKVSSKSASVSSKTSISPSPGIKNNITPLTKSTAPSSTADPAITQVHSVGQTRQSRSSSLNNTSQSHKNADSASLSSRDGPTEPSFSQSSSVLGQHLTHSPVLSIKPHESFNEEQNSLERTGSFALNNNASDDQSNKNASAEQPGLVDHSQPALVRSSKHPDQTQESTPQQNESRSNSRLSFGYDEPAISAIPKGLSRSSPRASVSRSNSIPSVTGEAVSNTELSNNPVHSRSREGSKPPVPNNRSHGYGMSRASTAESTTTIASLPSLNTAVAQIPKQTQKETRPQAVGDGMLSQLRSRLLSKDFWMRDENAKDCFHCGEPFTTFRRKHHCRTCGQIFDSKCTLLIPGIRFGQPGSIRVCKPCEVMINGHDDDSSEFSDSEQSPNIVNPRISELSWGSGSRAFVDDDDSSSVVSQSIEHVLKTPQMAIPATRRPGEGHNKSAVLEIKPDRSLARPTSSRSLKSSMGGRPHTTGHRRHPSHQQYIRSFKPRHDDRAPFQRRHADEYNSGSRLPAFHKDNIIDPDLAQYLSDDASSGDEQPSLMSTFSDNNLSKSGGENDRALFGSLFAAMKKGRSAFGDRSTPSVNPSYRDPDEASVSSSRAVNLPRSSRRRNLSVASSVHRPSPRVSKDLVFSPDIPESAPIANHQSGHAKQTRSSSMRGREAPPVELNKASLQHVRRLLRQLLTEAAVPNEDSWETSLMPILLKAADEVNPDVLRGDDMDIRHYVKLKKIPGGRPGDTSYVSGLVFTKNLALKSMQRSISHPNILILTFPLEYARHQQQFMSLEPVIRQEREFLENLVSRIAALQPTLLLVENNISGLALELLGRAGIATAYNVKPSVLEAVSRCTQTRIVTSMDKLLTTTLHSECGSFDVKTFVYANRKKTYMYISGCPKSLGCTIVLRGANEKILAKVKEITEFMIYVVYNLRLETCLMRDEFAKLPTSCIDDEQASSDIASKPHILATAESLASTEVGTSQTTAGNKSSGDVSNKVPTTADSIEIPDNVPHPTYYNNLIQDHKTKLLSASPFVKYEPPYLLMRVRELERRLDYLKSLRDQDGYSEQSLEEKAKPQKFILITPEMVHESPHDAPPKVKEVLRAAHDAEYDRVLYHYQTQKRQWEAYVSGNSNMFDPYAHQNIVVLYSLVCTTTSIPCSGPDTFAIEFYNEHGDDVMLEPDCTVGQYVEDLCHTANTVCTANGCEKLMLEHHRQYVHGDAQVSVLVQPHPPKVRGMQNTILMWSCCKICGNETQVTPMSEATWKYSFGKYLEICFWGRNLHARAEVCPHDLQRDYLRYFGFQDMALRIQYDKIHILDIVVPRPRVTWKVDNDLRMKNDVYMRTENRLNKFMMSVLARLESINVKNVLPELLSECEKEIEGLTRKAKEDHLALIQKLQDKYTGSRYWEIIPLNEALRSVQERVVEWDTIFAEFEKKFLPSEKDIKRLAGLQIKKIFLDKDASVNPEDPLHTPPEASDENVREDEKPRMLRRMTLSPEKAQDVLVSVVEEDAGKKYRGTPPVDADMPPLPMPVDESSPVAEAINGKRASPQDEAVSNEEFRFLDLAVPVDQSSQVKKVPRHSDIPDQSLNEVHHDNYQKDPSQSKGPGAFQNDQLQPSDGNVRTPSTPPNRPSGIPRLAEGAFRKSAQGRSPPLVRAQSQPPQQPGDRSGRSSPFGMLKYASTSIEPAAVPQAEPSKSSDKKLKERLTALKNGRFPSGHSFIPRSTPKPPKPTRANKSVPSLTRHFEQLSREFEKERQRERQRRAARSTQSRAFPLASSKPIVEVYRNVREAVGEREPRVDGEEPLVLAPRLPADESSRKSDDYMGKTNPEEITPKSGSVEHSQGSFEPEEIPRPDSQLMLGDDQDDAASDEDRPTAEDLHPVDSQEESKLAEEESFKDLGKHERTTLLKMLTNFWSERSASGWSTLDYPLSVMDHVFADSDIVVREDEPSSLVAFTLDHPNYKEQLAISQQKYQTEDGPSTSGTDTEAANEVRVEQALLQSKSTHVLYHYTEGQAKMWCKVFYTEQFHALRVKCGVADRIVESLSRCAKWDSKGGKTRSLFLKTLDDRFILKSLSTIETQAFLKFAPAYFQIMSEALFHELPSAIAKMFGFYQVTIKNPVTGTEFNWFLLLMENLFYDRVPNRIFDLKGSMRNRKVESTGERDEVLLDENMVDFIYETPLFSREHSKKLLSQSVWNDTLFLGRQNVMDYSLMIAIDDQRSELVVGIIDCIRTYTWDKKLESWIKDRGFAGGGRNRPTVTSPREISIGSEKQWQDTFSKLRGM
ncbi:hypothetical protein N7468_005249 [Penicillium chermesinum]|uniref:1-phosphatidylinositol-3-phosphate 5-kinase n=1 Tax=Penicillium chermesinum TaxID=63820 RepID=A0A9W9NYU3_9EURO|nr:uncharacterized protein N7468_005249 [Penicillium chermesinum]KAJ5232293.1 hypothetical protein N7468_005249 [Penicillium chermesinum]